MGDSQTLVDVFYKGLKVGGNLPLTEVGPTTAYVQLAEPMPVGTTLQLKADDAVVLASVIRVHEQIGNSDRQAGVYIRAGELGAAAEWWNANVSTSDAAIPESASGGSSPVVSSRDGVVVEAQDSTRQTEVMTAVTLPEEVALGAGETHTMNGDELRDLVEKTKAELVGGDTAETASVSDAPEEKKKGKKKRRRGRRSRG